MSLKLKADHRTTALRPTPPRAAEPQRAPFPIEVPASPRSVLHTRVVTGRGGGPDKTILQSPRYFDPKQLDVAAAYIHPKDDPGIELFRDRAVNWRCPLHQVAEAGPIDPKTVRDLYRLCRKLNVAVWHGHDYKTNALGLLIRRMWPMKLVTTVHGWTRETLRTKLYYHVDNWCLSRYDQVITVSPALTEHCQKLGIDQRRLTYIPNGIDPRDYERRHTVAGARRQLGVPNDRAVIGVVGRLSVEKGADRAIRMLAGLKKTVPNAELHLIGDGPQRAELESLTRDLSLTNAVHFHGWQSGLHRYYEMMDVLLLPSHTEGLPNAVLEGMAIGVPIAATNVGGVGELLEYGRCGFLLNDDPDTWPERVSPLLTYPGIAKEFARRARRRVETEFSFRNRMSRVAEVYAKVLPIDAHRCLAPQPAPAYRQAA